MKLNDTEKRILSVCSLRADISHKQIAKLAKLKVHTVQYSLTKLESRGVLKRTPLVNLPVLGFTMFNIYFSLSARSSKRRILDSLLRHPNVLWVAELGGDYQYAIELTTKNLSEVLRTLESIGAEEFMFRKSVSSQFSVNLFERQYLNPGRKGPFKTLSMEQAGTRVEIDKADELILKHLGLGFYQSIRQVARTLELPESTVADRIARLKKRGVLLGEFYTVDATAFGMLVYKILLSSNTTSRQLSERMREFCRDHPNVVHMVHCFGAWDYTIEIEVESPQSAVGINQEIIEHFEGAIFESRLIPKFSDLKVSLYPFT